MLTTRIKEIIGSSLGLAHCEVYRNFPQSLIQMPG
jgi:hypothetical protein